MVIYADHTHDADGPALLEAMIARLQALATVRTAGHDDLASGLIDLGTFESSVADAVCPEEDAPHPLLEALRRASESLGLVIAASWRAARTTAPTLQPVVSALREIAPAALPARLTLRTPEGYAFYALYPEAYAEVAFEWTRAQRPGRMVCVGLRSIGTSLSAVVHGAITLAGGQAVSWTLRPHGHPFDRRVAIAGDLARRWRIDRDVFLVVDEGPGLSGSSLAGTAAALSALGVPDDRIILMAAWHPDVERLRSPAARQRWPRHTVLTAPFDRVRARVLEAHGIAADAPDISAGRWRHVLACPQPWPASHPQHERLKIFPGDGRLMRFAGLGHHGHLARARAERLTAGGWTAPPDVLSRGLLTQRFTAGVPLAPDTITEADIQHAAEYIAWLRRHESTGTEASVTTIAGMLLVNAREGLGEGAAAAAESLIAEARVFTEPAVAIDGRLLPHEWIRTPGGLIKTDALDHHCDHFLPGPTDPAWDLAGLIVESRLTGGARASCVSTYVRASGDAGVSRRLPFYTAAYLAFRMGYCAMADAAVDAQEQRRFTAARARYARALRAALGGAGVMASAVGSPVAG